MTPIRRVLAQGLVPAPAIAAIGLSFVLLAGATAIAAPGDGTQLFGFDPVNGSGLDPAIVPAYQASGHNRVDNCLGDFGNNPWTSGLFGLKCGYLFCTKVIGGGYVGGIIDWTNAPSPNPCTNFNAYSGCTGGKVAVTCF